MTTLKMMERMMINLILKTKYTDDWKDFYEVEDFLEYLEEEDDHILDGGYSGWDKP